MTTKNWCLSGVAVVLAASYIAFFTEWFKPQTVNIFHINGNLRVTNPQSAALRGMMTCVIGERIVSSGLAL